LRGQVFRRDEGRCRLCGRICGVRPRDWVADHIVPKDQGGLDELSNLRLLCRDCHENRHDRGGARLCGCEVDQKPPIDKDAFAHLDHIVPLSKGGQHILSNVQTLCRKCNITKSDTLPVIGDSLCLQAG